MSGGRSKLHTERHDPDGGAGRSLRWWIEAIAREAYAGGWDDATEIVNFLRATVAVTFVADAEANLSAECSFWAEWWAEAAPRYESLDGVHPEQAQEAVSAAPDATDSGTGGESLV